MLFISASEAVAEFTDLHWFRVVLLQDCKVAWVSVIYGMTVLHLAIALFESALKGVVLGGVLFFAPWGGHLAT